MATITDNYKERIKHHLDEIEDLIFDWMSEMDMPDGMTIDDVHYECGDLMDTISAFFKEAEEKCNVDGPYDTTRDLMTEQQLRRLEA